MNIVEHPPFISTAFHLYQLKLKPLKSLFTSGNHFCAFCTYEFAYISILYIGRYICSFVADLLYTRYIHMVIHKQTSFPFLRLDSIPLYVYTFHLSIYCTRVFKLFSFFYHCNECCYKHVINI